MPRIFRILFVLGRIQNPKNPPFPPCFLVYLIQWMNMNGILPPEQSGFREKHSTATRFVHFLQHISSGLLQQTATLVIYVDFIKAFDQLWHDGLLHKLHQMNCPYELVIFIVEYLKNRKGYIEMNRLVSSIFDVEKGVPQGSCLGPILFLLFHCELPRQIPSATYNHLYANDLALIIHASPWWCRSEFVSQMQPLCEKVLKQVQAYAIEWKQPINFPKTVWQWIHRIKRTSLFKYLGHFVDERFSFSQHCNKMLQENQNNARLLKYVARSKTSLMKTRNLIFQAFIQPHFQMIYAVWPLLSNYCIEKKSKRRIDKSITFFKTGQTQPTMKCGGFRIS